MEGDAEWLTRDVSCHTTSLPPPAVSSHDDHMGQESGSSPSEAFLAFSLKNTDIFFYPIGSSLNCHTISNHENNDTINLSKTALLHHHRHGLTKAYCEFMILFHFKRINHMATVIFFPTFHHTSHNYCSYENSDQ